MADANLTRAIVSLRLSANLMDSEVIDYLLEVLQSVGDDLTVFVADDVSGRLELANHIINFVSNRVIFVCLPKCLTVVRHTGSTE